MKMKDFVCIYLKKEISDAPKRTQLRFVTLIEFTFVKFAFIEFTFIEFAFIELPFVEFTFVKLAFIELPFVKLSFVRQFPRTVKAFFEQLPQPAGLRRRQFVKTAGTSEKREGQSADRLSQRLRGRHKAVLRAPARIYLFPGGMDRFGYRSKL